MCGGRGFDAASRAEALWLSCVCAARPEASCVSVQHKLQPDAAQTGRIDWGRRLSCRRHAHAVSHRYCLAHVQAYPWAWSYPAHPLTTNRPGLLLPTLVPSPAAMSAPSTNSTLSQMPAEQQCVCDDEDMAEAAGGEDPPSLEEPEVATVLAVGAAELSPDNRHARTEGMRSLTHSSQGCQGADGTCRQAHPWEAYGQWLLVPTTLRNLRGHCIALSNATAAHVLSPYHRGPSWCHMLMCCLPRAPCLHPHVLTACCLPACLPPSCLPALHPCRGAGPADSHGGPQRPADGHRRLTAAGAGGCCP